MRRGRNGSGIIGWIFAAIVLGAIGFMAFSPTFEREDPKVTLSHEGYWNFKHPITVSVEDQS